MTYKEAIQLHNGDEVFWVDPDNGKCSRHYIIGSIEVGPRDGRYTPITICDIEGDVLQCFLGELR